jgi:hypothetical protein
MELRNIYMLILGVVAMASTSFADSASEAREILERLLNAPPLT